MTVNYKKSAIYIVRGYLVQQLFAEGVLVTGDYLLNGFDTPLSPVVPVQDLPEFSDELSDKTYIVYDLITEVDPVQYWARKDEVTFVTFSEKTSKHLEVIEFFVDQFSQADLTAEALNAYAVAQNSPFRFESFNLIEAAIGDAAKEEAGKKPSPVVISYSYRRLAS